MLKRTLFFLTLNTLLVAGEPELKKGLLERMIQPKLSYTTAYVSDAKVGESDGSVSVVKNSLRLNNKIASLTYNNWAFRWKNIADLPFGDGANNPLKQMHGLNLSITFPYFINDDWFLLTSLSLKSTFEKEMKESYGGGVFSFASYKIDEKHTLQMGAFANYHRVSSIALPVISYSYRARQRDGFVLILGFPRAYMGYHINESLLLRSGMIFSQSVIKLSSQSPIESSGFIESENYMGNIGAVYELNDSFTFEGDILYSLKREFILYDTQGEEHNSFDVKPSFGASFRLKYLF